MDKAIDVQRMALEEATSIGGPGQHQHMDALANHLLGRHALFGTDNDLEEAIRIQRAAVDICPPTHSEREFVLNKLASALRLRFQRLGSVEDLNEAVIVCRQALAVRRPNSTARPYTLDILAQLLTSRFQVSSASDSDLDELVEVGREAVRICPPHQNDHWIRLDTLADSFQMRFTWTGSLADLEETIELRRRAVDHAPAEDPRRWVMISNLAGSLRLRFTELGHVDDINETVRLYRQVSDTAAANVVDHPDRLLAMVSSLCLRFKTLRSVEDLNEAIEISELVLGSIPSSHAFRPRAIKCLADALVLRARPEDLDNAVRSLEENKEHVRPSSSFSTEYALALGDSLSCRFSRIKQASDAERAREVLTVLLDRLPPGRRDRFQCLLQLSELHLDIDSPYFDVSSALQYIAEGIRDDHRDVRFRLQGTMRVLRLIEPLQPDFQDVDCSIRTHLLDIYGAVVALLPRVAYFSLDLSSRLHSLAIGQSAAITGAACALTLSRPQRALEILEQGRGIFWSHSFRLRSQFDDVPEVQRRQLLALAHQLERSNDALPDQSDDRLMEKALSRRRKQSEEFNSLVEEIRSMPGLDRFMLHDTYATLAKAADKGPVIVILPSAFASFAIIIRSDREPVSIPLPSLSEDWIAQSSGTWRSAVSEARNAVRNRLKLQKIAMKVSQVQSQATLMEDVLEGLWTKVVKPIMLELKLKPRSGRRRPRLWWCLTGNLAHLPIHAAGVRRKQGCSDYVVSSYIPTLGELLYARSTSQLVRKRDAKALLVAVPQPRAGGWVELPSTLEEVREVEAILPASALIPLSEGSLVKDPSSVTSRALLDALSNAHVLHLACHGVQDPTNPLQSGFVLGDGILTIDKLMGISLPRAFLAFLSACETAKGDRSQPDQAVHLAATMIFAGFKSVIATLWSMEDIDGPLVAKSVYEQLFKHDVDSEFLEPDDVAYALDEAIRQLRSVHPEPSRWAPYIHMGI
ncbi:hypothetical protein PUNSTDRAFT_136302 [Punctularia strigosozonata HHB-11173 SS5]|uniref:uncharacterized protein n=1 Tax=Punctularia strigosozonata (strain HHB-11173) TaxID=741275 RepID=UPI0004417BCA|nr:uncharacterized protein PUNSTDRAFT_136302 [Punctularia strigosozonata HHB-11173 SS5]EIN06443.1 hypothetical protein PUNSTDRAFT_136302 [Punctularia strigosozonata HHB-11173 SS5]